MPMDCSDEDQVAVNVQIPPLVNIAGETSICPGSSALLDAGIFAAYLWSTGATTRTIAIAAAGNYSVTVTDTEGCEGSAQMTITENTAPQPSITGTADICPGATSTLDAGAFTSYLWSTGATTQTISVNAAGNYSVIVTDANGCQGSDQISVSEHVLIQAQITGSLSFCPGASTILDAGVFMSYLWSTGETAQTISVNTAGDYGVTVTDGNGCQSSDQVTIDEQATLQPQIAGNLTFCPGTSTLLDAGVFDAYLWSNGETTQTILVSAPGDYMVTVTNSDGCSGEDQVTIDVLSQPSVSIMGENRHLPRHIDLPRCRCIRLLPVEHRRNHPDHQHQRRWKLQRHHH